MFTQWAVRRLCKFLLKKRIGRYIRGDLDLEQLEVQLGSGVVHLSDVALNTDYINEQLADLPLVLKEGSLGSVTLKLHWKVQAAIEIEVDEVELVLSPRTVAENVSSRQNSAPFDDFTLAEAQHTGLEYEPAGGCTYLPVHEGVRVVANLVESLLLGMHVRIRHAIVAFEERPGSTQGLKRSTLVSHSMVVARIEYAEYGIDYSSGHSNDNCHNEDDPSAEKVILTKAFRFQQMTFEVLDIYRDGSECPNAMLINERTGGGRSFGQPVSILQGNEGLSGCVQLSIPWQSGCLDIPKFNADINISFVKLWLTAYKIQQLLNVAGSFRDCSNCDGTNVVDCDSNQNSILKDNGLFVVKATDDSIDGLVCSPSVHSELAAVGSQSKHFSPTLLPVTRVISDWLCRTGCGNQAREEPMSEADFAASTDEFFDCFDGTRSSQASLGGSGLWNWTCSAFSAITTASSLASGSILISQDSAKPVEYVFKVNMVGLSVKIAEEETLTTSVNTGSVEHMKMVDDDHLSYGIDDGLSESFSKSTCDLHSRISKSSKDEERMSTDATVCSDHSRDEYLEVFFLDLSISLQVSENHLESHLMVKEIEALESQCEPMHDDEVSQKQSACSSMETIGSCAESLQVLVENALPIFPVSLCADLKAYKRQTGCNEDSSQALFRKAEQPNHKYGLTSESRKTNSVKEQRKRCFLRVSGSGHPAAGHMIVKQSALVKQNCKNQGCTNLEIYLGPLIVWLDSSVVCKLMRLVDMFAPSETQNFSMKAWSESDGNDSHANRFAISSTNIIDIDAFIPCIRLLTCLPVPLFPSVPRLWKDNLLCLDLNAPATKLKRPLFSVKLYNYLHPERNRSSNDSLDFAFINSSLYLLSPTDNIPTATNHSNQCLSLSFSAHKILSVSGSDCRPAILEVLLRGKVGQGTWLAELAWSRVMEQQKQGMVRSETGKGGSEFAAATATEVVDENNCRVREDILSNASICICATLPCVKLELSNSQHATVLSLVNSVTKDLLFEGCLSNLQYEKGTSDVGSTSSDLSDKDNQISVSVDIQKVEIVLYPKANESEAGSEQEREGDRPWEVLRIFVNKLQVLHALNLGMTKKTSYFWLHHEDGHLGGALVDATSGEQLLLTCRNEALGRGDGGGGNALASSSAGIDITSISWPGRYPGADMLINVTVRGGTFMAHGGRLDWLSTLVAFFAQPIDKLSTQRAIFERFYGQIAETNLVMQEIGIPEPTNCCSDNCSFFSLDLHDVALCYEPGKEALAAASVRASGIEDEQLNTMEPFAPVACVLAAAAIRVSSNAISSTPCKEYGIWLRDVALLLVDTTLRRTQIEILDYIPDSLRQAGYVKVAGEAVMEAVVRINSEEGLLWEVECANNQLRLDTCHDTTAALGRLFAQFQQLFTPGIDQSAIPLYTTKNNKDVEARADGDCFSRTPEDSDSSMRSFPDILHSERRTLFEGIIEDAFTFVRDGSYNWDTSVNADSFSHDCIESDKKRGESPGRYEMLERSDSSSDNITETNFYQPLGCILSDVQTKDFWTPISRKEGPPSFIEDYCVTKNACSHSSPSSSSKDGCELSENVQSSTDEFYMLDDVDESGGWYDDHSLRVLEDYVPEVSKLPGCKKQRGGRFHHATKRRALATQYPQSVGRVILQGLNLQWRLYGGSDWPVAKKKDTVGLSHAYQGQYGRQLGVCLEVILKGVELQHDTFPESVFYASRLAVSIRDVRVYDCSKNAPWKKVLGYHRLKSRPRESSAQALKLELDSVRPDPSIPLEEYCLSIQLLPVLLHLDQCHVDFFVNFFPSSAPSSSPQLHFGYEEIPIPNETGLGGSTFVTKAADASEEALLPFFQNCELHPFTIRVDYVPRRVDITALRGGNYAELINLVSWKGIELQLKHVHAAGVHGWGTLSGIIVGEWLEDISRNQIHKVIRGLGPIRPLFAVGSGAAKLIVLPAEHYRRDRRRLLRGMRKGAIAFLRSISLEAVGLGVQLAAGAHEILLHTESALNAVALSHSLGDRVEIPNKFGQPGDTLEGLQQARESLTRGLERTASSLIGNPLKVYQRGAGTSSAVASALRAAPAAAVAPASAAARAVHRALLGVRNSLDPENQQESEEAHSGPPPE